MEYVLVFLVFLVVLLDVLIISPSDASRKHIAFKSYDWQHWNVANVSIEFESLLLFYCNAKMTLKNLKANRRWKFKCSTVKLIHCQHPYYALKLLADLEPIRQENIGIKTNRQSYNNIQCYVLASSISQSFAMSSLFILFLHFLHIFL